MTAPSRTTRTSARRGNVIILAVAVLAIMAVSAASYVTITRLDSANSRAYSRRGSFDEQTRIVVSHMQAVLAADLFGNKVVTNAVPRRLQNAPTWPDMFEDGESWDYPTTAVVDPNAPGVLLYNYTVPLGPADLPRQGDSFVIDPRASVDLRLAYTDDAWLASAEPADLDSLNGTTRANGGGVFDGGSALPNGLWDAWPQVTNLKTAYEWDPRRNGQFWVRGDGRYVDLANFFLSEKSRTTGRGDPGAELFNVSQDPTYGGTIYNPLYGENDLQNEPSLEFGLRQPVYHMQMNMMHEWIAANGNLDADSFVPPDPDDPALQGDYQQVDLRMWADTDGDSRPDARWQELDALGSALGLRWVVAARIIDSSSMVNVNSSVGFGDLTTTANYDTIGSGVTPADIDLFRLLDSTMYSQNPLFPAHPDLSLANELPSGARVLPGYNEHLTRGLNLVKHPTVIDTPGPNWTLEEFNLDLVGGGGGEIDEWGEQLKQRDILRSNAGWDTFKDGNVVAGGAQIFNTPLALTRNAKEAYYRFVGVSPQDSLIGTVTPYPLSDEIDLRAFWGLNYNVGVSKLEQRLDGPEQHPFYNRLPGHPKLWPTNGSVGVLRSNESAEDVRTFNDTADLPVSNGSTQPYNQADKVQRIERDVRRLLTLYNGVGTRSPVSPKNDESIAGGPASLGKLTATDFPQPVERLTNEPGYDQRMSRFLQDATGAFMWALAPFATDRPLMRGAPYGVVDPQYQYGNGSNGPAQKIEAELGVSSLGAMYPLIRAASLAVNLVDAQDYEDGDPETPTIVRVLREYDVPETKSAVAGTPATGPLGTSIPNDKGVAEIGVSFAQGDLPLGGLSTDPVDALPSAAGGGAFPANGAVLAGLDTQPFLVGAYSFEVHWAIFDVPFGFTGSSLPVDPTTDAFGVALAFKIGNPWPSDGKSPGIELDKYKVVLTDGTQSIQIPLDGTVPWGETAIVYVVNSIDPSTDNWESNIESYMDSLSSNVVNLDFGGVSGDVVAGVRFYEGFTTKAASVLLVYDDVAAGTVPSPVLVDRLTPNSSAGLFPIAQFDPSDVPDYDNVFDDITQPTEKVSALFSAEAVLLRPGATANGFPGYVIERPSENQWENREADDAADGEGKQLFLGVVQSGFDLLTLNPAGLTAAFGDNAPNPTPAFVGAAPASFQLFVPNTNLLTPSETLRLSEYAHMYFGDSYGVGSDTTLNAARPSAATDVAWPTNAITDPWRTVSEQLGSSAHYFWDTTAQPSPFLGSVNYARHMPPSPFSPTGAISTGAANGAPNQMMVPFGARLPDVVETVASRTDLVQGRININTAPDRVLRALPWLDPRSQTYTGMASNIGGSGWNPDLTKADQRIEWIRSYRNNWVNWLKLNGATVAATLPANMTLINNLRRLPTGIGETEAFTSLGELALLGQWNVNGLQVDTPNISGTNPAMLELATGAAGFKDEPPLDFRQAYSAFDGVNDTEERLMLFQAISNVVSTRSDVFTAWFVIRAYDPKAIEAIDVPGEANNDNKRAALLNELSPAYESRWLVVFDRSNIRQPTDRPRIVMTVELPNTSP